VSDEFDRFVVRAKAAPPFLYMRIQRTWEKGVRTDSPRWGYVPGDATKFLSEEDAWAAFDRVVGEPHGNSYAVRTLDEETPL
jgi:hypothetical protein